MKETKDIIYYIIIIIKSIPWVVLFIGFMFWIISNETQNIHRKKIATGILVISSFFIYVFRFLPILVLSSLAPSNLEESELILGFSNFFGLIQLIVSVFVPPFSIIQFYIYKYQELVTEGRKSSSKRKQTLYLMLGLIVTPIVISLLELIKIKFR